MNRITFAANSMDVNVAGKTVGEIAEQVRGLLNLPDVSEVKAYVDGEEASLDTVVLSGQSIKFDRPMGSKGC